MKRGLAVIGLTCALAVGAPEACGNTASSEHHNQAATPATHMGNLWFRAADKATLKQTFAADIAYLKSNGFRRVAPVKLVLLEGKETFNCSNGQTTFTASGPGPEFCSTRDPHKVGSVIVNAAFVNSDMPTLINKLRPTPAKRRAISVAGEAYVIGHELGHAKQDVEDIISKEPLAIYEETKELQADCIGGGLIKATRLSLLADAKLFLGQISGDLDHGSTQQRVTALNIGGHGSSCTAQDILKIKT